MATKQWLVDNPKVLGYLPKTVYDQLQEFKAEQKVSVSKALAMILESYFELELPQSSAGTCTDERLNNLEQEVAAIKVAVDQWTEKSSSTEEAVVVEEAPTTEASPTTDASQPIRLKLNQTFISSNSLLNTSSQESTKPQQLNADTRSHKDESSEESPTYKIFRLTRNQPIEPEEPTQNSTEPAEADIETTESAKKTVKGLPHTSPESNPQPGGKTIQKFLKGMFSPPSFKPFPPESD